MKTLDIIRRSGRSLKQAKARTILTSLAIAVGAFTISLSLAAGEGARQYADKLIKSNVDPQSLYIAKDGALFGEGAAAPGTGLREYNENSTQYGGATFKALTADDIAKIRANKNIESVTPTYLVSAEYFQFESSDKKYVTDITVYDASIKAETSAGVLPPLNQQIGDDEIIVPESYATAAGYDNPEEAIGKTITLHLVKPGKEPTEAEINKIIATEGIEGLAQLATGEVRDVEFKIRAISAQSATSFTASAGLFISENQARDLSEFLTKGTDQYQKYVTASARVKEGVDPAVVKAELEKEDIKARTAEDLQALLFTIVNILQGIVLGFGVLALITSVFGIINTMYISVLERTQQIGLMKALGMRSFDVLKMFLFEAGWIGFIGGLAGAGVAFLVGTLLNPWITETLSLGEGTRLLIFLPIPIALLLIGLILVGMISGLLPARKAAKLDPIEALRTE